MKGKRKEKRTSRRTWRRFFPAGAALALLLLYLAVPLPDPLFPTDSGTVVLDRNGRILRMFLDDRQQWHMPPDPDSGIPDKLETAILLKEDRFFHYHPGVNPVSVLRALVQNIRAGGVVSGASTITMQLARMMEPKPRTLGNKILETLQAVKMEIRFTKKEILRHYLEHAPFGGNIVGYRAASLKYFGKHNHQLTWAQAATLTVIPNAPGLLAPGTNPVQLKQKRDRLLKRLHDAGYLDSTTLVAALRERVPDQLPAAPMLAPHAARLLHNQQGTGWIRTSLDVDLQRHVHELVRRHADVTASSGIRHAAVLVVENHTGFVRTYIGSPDFTDNRHQGQVDGVQAPRSTGSILKPFLYALAMDEGLINTQTKIMDIPTRYGTFSPANADESYGGLVPVPEALTRSLNVPAVRLLNAYGVRSFYDFLQEAGMQTLFRQPSAYGLPLVLGGSEATLWDLATLYRGLAMGGRFSRLRMIDTRPGQKPLPLVSPGAAWLTLEILRTVNRPGANHYWHMFEDQRPVAWKTGTSYGRRDAWAIGVSPDWTVAVWCGNFDGTGNPELGGARTAGPLLFSIIRILPRLGEQTWFKRPGTGFRKIAVCSRTGYPAGPDCPDTIPVEVPRDAHFFRTCPWHIRVELNDDESRAVCSRCWVPGHHHSASRLAYPPEVIQLMRSRGIQLEVVPPHQTDCPVAVDAPVLSILYPDDGTIIKLPRDFGGVRQELTCRAATARSETVVFWYLDGRFLGMTRRDHHLGIVPVPGNHQLTLVDQSGNRTRCTFRITP